MATAQNEPQQDALPWQKRVADLCTAARAPLAVGVIWLGLARGKAGIQATLIVLLLAATLDTLDGYFARLSHYPHQTWVGSHDLAFDIGFSVALLLYLSLAGYLSPYLAVLHAGFWLLVFGNQISSSNTLAVLFQAPIYIGVVLAAVLHNVNLMGWIAVWVGVMLAFAGKRFFHVRAPAFFKDLGERIPHRRQGVERCLHDHESVSITDREPGCASMVHRSRQP
jgi:phosphatidylglycerophosphate synthase